ncbi:Ig-like domain-containing protein [Shewanella algicola]|uniref:Ig-like domain-containing protein n=1 Tax=Shewanella algicola TaxID=640633 RepID=A0A9X1ZC73_9GAMM|nr:Ig-like domain-containing protein [Shewanella algicola]MCL1107672.1 Ig-like domain-containing protein [Shewanella algicola]
MNGLMRFLALLMILGGIPMSYASSNANTLMLPEIKALALDELVLDRKDEPVTVLETPVITNADGKVAQGLTKVKVSLASDAESSLIVQGKALKPGQSMTIVQDLTATGGVLKIPFYPEVSNVAGTSHYSLDVPNITAEICPDSYILDSTTNTCQKVNTASLLYTCPNSSWTKTSDLSKCVKLTEIAKSSCPEGFDSNGDGTCTKTEYENTVAKCSTGFTYSTSNDRCEKTIVVVADKTCSDPSYTYVSATNDCRKTVTKTVDYDCLAGFTYNSSLKVCERTLSTEADPLCETGYSYSTANSRCEKTVSQVASRTCPSGFTYSIVNDQCEKPLTEAADPVCASGYTYSSANSRCEKTLTQTASKVCASGYSFSTTNNRCEKTTTKSADPVCASGYTYSSANSRCEKTLTETASKICSSGYSYSATNDRCEKTTTKSAEPVCASGYTYSSANSRCEKTLTQTASKICASGYTYSATNNRCEKTLTQSAAPVCASGYTYSYSNLRCEKTLTQTASKVCSSGYTYSATNNRCEKTTTKSADPVCASGYSYSSANNRCEKMVMQTASKVCASGYTYSATNNRCEKTTTKSADPVCASGYSYSSANSRCEKTLTQTASKVCASGYTYSATNNRCEKTSTLAADPVCASGYSYSSANSRCEKTLTQTASKVCASGYTYSSTNNRCEKTSTKSADPVCASGYTYSSANSRCEKTLIQTASKICASGYSYSSVNTRCEKTTTKSADPVCASGYTYSSANSRCEKTVTQTASKVCASGYAYSSTNNRCEKTVTTTPNCASGYTFNSSSYTCEKTVTTTAGCVSGALQDSGQCLASGNLCVVFKDYMNDMMGFNKYASSSYKAPSTCKLIESSGAYIETGLNTSMYCDSFNSSTGMCSNYAESSCPSGYQSVSSTLCAKTTTVTPTCASGSTLINGMCTQLLTANFSYNCPANYTLSGSSCSRLVTAANTWECSGSGYSLSGSTCSKLETADFSYNCPSNYTLSGSSCSRLVTAANTWECSGSGYSLSGSTCSKLETDAFSYNCPANYSLNGDSCSRLLTAANTWKCSVSGYSLSGSTCSKLETASFSYNCPSNYTLSGSSCSRLLTDTNTWKCSGSGYSLNGSLCSKFETADFSYNCDANYSLNGDSCSRLLTANNTWKCNDARYTLSGSTCSLLEVQPFSYNCPINYALSGDSCSQLLTVNNTWKCNDSGYSLSGDSCSKLVTTNFSYNCPENYSLSGSSCSRLLTATNTWKCSDSGYSLSGNSCSLLETQPFSYNCQENYSLSGSSCSRLLTANNSWKCSDSGYLLSGNSCSLLETQPFNYNCPSDYSLENSTCSKLVSQANTWSCDSNWSLSGSTCHFTDTLAYSFTCPINYVNHNDGNCTQLQNKENAWTCPSNYVNHSDGSCTLDQTAPYTLSCSDSTYSPDSTTEVCNKTLTNAHIYKCGDPAYTLSGSSCSLLVTDQEEWICDDASFDKISETQCLKQTDTNLVGSCPVGYVKSSDGKYCEFKDVVAYTESCSASFALNGGECVKDVYFTPVCSTSFVDSSCTCNDGMTLNTTTLQCEGNEKTPVLKSCPDGYSDQNGQCEYHKTVDVVYDYCPLGMTAQDGKCILIEDVSTTETCNTPYSLQNGTCQYIDSLPAGYVTGMDSTSFEGDIKTEISSITLGNKTFDAIVSEMSEIAVDNVTGCRLVESEALAKGAINKGDVPCFVKWTSLPEGIAGTNDKVSGIFQQPGIQSLEYSLVGFNGNKITEFEISTGTIDLTVTEPPKPVIEDITTRLMGQVFSGFEMYNYSEDSQLSFTTVLVEPRTYIQKVTIDGVGTCNVPEGESSCTIYSGVGYTKDLDQLQFDSDYKIIANSKIGGWNESVLLTKDWVIHHDFRGPNIAFTNFNPTLENEPVVNTDLGFTVAIAGGEGAVGITNFRPELASTDTWWKPSRVQLVFTAKEGTKSESTITVDGNEISFDIPNNNADSKTLTNSSVLNGNLASAYPFVMTSLTPGEYTVQVIAKDTYNNETIETYDDVVVARPLPQIKVLHKGRSIENLSSAQTVNMLDDLTIVAHNGVLGESTIKSIKIDGREAFTTNSENYFKKLTGENFGLEANTSYVMDVEVEDKDGRVSSLSLPFNYLQMTFAVNHNPVTVIQKVEDVALTVNRTRGIQCDLYGTKAAAALASNDNKYACYIEWSELPDGLTPTVTTYQSKISGAVSELGLNRLSYHAYIVNKTGRVAKVGSETLEFEAIAPQPLELELDDKLKLSDGVYSLSINDTLLGRYNGKSSRANVAVSLSNENGDEKFYKHNQLPFGETQTFSGYAEKLGDSVLWDKVGYTLEGHYSLAPEINIVKQFDLIVTPHPYMQVLMELDSPKYASTETISASIQLGLRNNATGLFEYDASTMGTGWDVYLAFKNGTDYEPITETKSIGATGEGVIELDANIIFERNQAVYAVARAQSPYPDIEVQRVSIPRSITVVKGTAVEGEVVSRVVQSRIPANFDVRFDTASYDDFRVMGNIDWQMQRADGAWISDDELADRQYISIKSTSPETIKIRAVVTNKETGVVTNSDEVTLISYDIPKITIAGSSQAISGQEVELIALDNSDTPQGDAIVEWSIDNGETWLQADSTFKLTVADSLLKVKARMKYANTSSEVESGQWSEAIKYISVTKPKPLTVNVAKPSFVEVGTQIELKLQVVNPFISTGVESQSEWELPDGTVISNESTITYLVKEADLDGSQRLNLKVKAWLKGYKDVTLGESNIIMNTFSYTFPTDDKLSLSINNNVKFVPSTGFATLNMPYISAPGVSFEYEWSFDENAIEKTGGYGKSMSFKVIQAGVHKVTLTLSDNRDCN